jgi:hypothetical protein
MTTQGFWRETTMDNRRLALIDKARVNNVHYLFPQGGGPRGSFTNFTDLSHQLQSRDLILMSGVLKEQAMTPVGVYDVTILGAANRPRQATNGGVPTGGGASWLAPTVVAANKALLEVIEQGWHIENIQMAPPAALDCIRFRRMETAAIPDGSHGVVKSCYFSTGGAAGHFINIGECKRIVIEGNEFEAIGAGKCIRNTADGGIAAPSYLTVRNNKFGRGNTYEIVTTAADALIEGNTFMRLFGVEAGMCIDLNGSAGRNRILNNYFSDATAQFAVAGGYRTGAATDRWRNWVGDAADPIVANPA